MTALINPMPLAIRVSELHAQTSEADADDRARRLAASVAQGDDLAFAELYDRYHKRLFRFALALGRGDEALANETVQSAFLTAAAKLRSVQSEEHLWNWLAHVARQHLSKSWRRQQRDASIINMADVPEQMNFESDHLLEEKLDSALLSMDGAERELIEWFYFDGLSHKEIARRTKATPKAVSSRLERARARLRTTLTQKFSKDEP